MNLYFILGPSESLQDTIKLAVQGGALLIGEREALGLKACAWQ